MKLASPTNTLVLQLLRHLADGKNLAFAAAATHLTVDQARDIASGHGYPDRQKMGWAADIIARNIDEQRRTEGFTEGSAAPTQRVTPPTPAPSATNGVAKPADSIGELLRRGKQSTKKPTQRLLAIGLEAETEAAQAKVRAARAAAEAKRKVEVEKAEALADVKRLEEQLREAKARLRGSKTKTSTSPTAHAADRTRQGEAARRRHQHQREFLEEHQVTAGEIRAWAAKNGHQVGHAGLLPEAVLTAWAEAAPGAA